MLKNKVEYKKILLDNQVLPVEEQIEHKDIIEQAFLELVKSNPTRKEYNKYVIGLVLTANMLYDSIKYLRKR